MVGRIIVYFLFSMMVLALFIFFMSGGTLTEITLDSGFYSGIKSVSRIYDNWKLTIPKIKNINVGFLDSADGKEVIGVLRRILRFFVTFANLLISVLNILASIVNVLINVLQFLISFVIGIKDMLDGIIKQNSNLAVFQ